MTSDNVAGAQAASPGSGAGDNAAPTAAQTAAADARIVDALAHALVERALPGEVAEFTDADRIAAAEFVAACAARRPTGIALVRVEPQGGALGHRRMRIGIVNDDMPFLVDSVANTLAARNLTVHRLLHPWSASPATRTASSARSSRTATIPSAANR
jgi:NAD-specific glutamate dehydrogenase